MVNTATIRGRRYQIRWVNNLGDSVGKCDHPTKPGKCIRIKRGESEQTTLDAVIHEALHAGLWDLDEEAVNEIATDIGRLLWRMGYRRTGDA